MFDKTLLNETRPYRRQFAKITLLLAAAAICTILFAYTLAKAAALVFLSNAAFQEIVPLLAVLFLSAALKIALRWRADTIAHKLTLNIQAAVQSRLLTAITSHRAIALTESKTGELLACFTEGIDQLDSYFAKFLPQFIAAITIPLIIVSLVLPIDFWTAGIFIITAPLIPLFMMLIGTRADAANRQQWFTLTTISNKFFDLLEGLTTLRIFNQSNAQKATIAKLSDDFRLATLRVLRIAFLSAFALELTATLSIATIAVTVGLRLLSNNIDFATAFFLLILAPEFYQPLRNLGSSFHSAMTSAAAAQKIFAFITAAAPPTAVTLPASKQKLLATKPALAIEFRGVYYTYQKNRETALNNLTFTAPAAQHTAIIGESGAGKSTILQLLLGFDYNFQGEILLGGIPLNTIDQQELHNYTAYLPQSPHIFAMTAADNIAVAKPAATMTEIIAAAKQANIHQVIEALPQGYATLLGEGGRQLSGGQKQRIAIARAFLKDAPLLLLDEPTAALDSPTAKQIDHALTKLYHNRTVITLTHRLLSARLADNIIILQIGQAIAAGNSASLLPERRLL